MLAGVLAAGSMMSGCTASRPDPSGAEGPATTAVRYSRDVEGIVASLSDLLSNDGSDLSHWAPPEDQAKCGAERLVRQFTANGLLDRGFDPNDATLVLEFTSQDRTAAINVLIGCIDFETGYTSLLSSYEKMSVAEAACVGSGMRRLGIDRDIAGSLVDGAAPDPLANGQRFGQGMSELATQCLATSTLSDQPLSLPPPAPADAPRVERSEEVTSTTAASPGTGPDLRGIVPGGPLDTSN
ncbi:MAG TPA: hypothetical protein PLP95_07390 [Microthrixaceae bacterium]|nr:hypothetical protein [Microthrixaceae bacterium]